jgi:hypothetical protein
MYVTYERFRVPPAPEGELFGDDRQRGREEVMRAAAAQAESGNIDAAAKAMEAQQKGISVATNRAPDPRLTARFPVRFTILGR